MHLLACSFNLTQFADVQFRNAAVTLFFRDHKGDTLRKATHYANEFIRDNPLAGADVKLVGGVLGIIAAVNEILLDGRPPPDLGPDVVVVPPVHVDPTASVRRSVIGPHVSVGAGARVCQAVVRNSIIGEEASVENIVLADSLVGFQAAVAGRSTHLNVGDLSQITS